MSLLTQQATQSWRPHCSMANTLLGSTRIKYIIWQGMFYLCSAFHRFLLGTGQCSRKRVQQLKKRGHVFLDFEEN